jgi:hypothetical protein
MKKEMCVLVVRCDKKLDEEETRTHDDNNNNNNNNNLQQITSLDGSVRGLDLDLFDGTFSSTLQDQQ